MAFVAGALISGSISLVAQNGSGWVFGYGTQSCGQWLAGRNGPDFYSNMAWIQGFLSGLALFLPTQKTDHDAIAAWVDNYCAQNPLKTIKDAAEQLSIELSPPPSRTAQPNPKK
jgi:hypothetical protein